MSEALAEPQPSPEPLGPDSLTWKYFGQWSGLMVGLWAGSMQNMHPGLGAAVEEHSEFFTERWERLLRSLYPITGVVFDGERAPETALKVRGYHNMIKGVDKQGRRYHALDPDTFYWAHSTFFYGMVRSAELLHGGVTLEQKRQMFDEHIQWYRLYDMSMRPVPASWEDFERYWDHMCREVLEINKATLDVLDTRDLPRPTHWWWLPNAVWPLLRLPVTRFQLWQTNALYDQAIRDKLGWKWTALDERLFRLYGKLHHRVWQLVPHDWRRHPRARQGWRRARGQIPADTPLLETPARNLPPVHRRHLPMHYSPDV
ncbi:DUF2236 domain-containing protein [Pseudonocardiaceae bacterium YIM PH 21723]|nr:DUF2236 domain-containing protein [Pseudonocardiaceae bacterium YIM PH 21723]